MVVVEPSALRHGLSEADVAEAWEGVFEYIRCKDGKLPPHYMALGSLADGRTVELVAYSDGLDWHVFHAMTPPQAGFMHEFKTNRRKGTWR